MGERVPIFPKNDSYQYPANLQKRQIYCGFQGAQPLGRIPKGSALWWGPGQCPGGGGGAPPKSPTF